MNEASSKYVDQIAVQKLLAEKLSRVHHAPDGVLDRQPFADFDAAADAPTHVQATTVRIRNGTATELAFRSAITSGYEENDQVRCRWLHAERPKSAVVLVHGLFEDNLDIYTFFLAMLAEQGCDVYLLVLPYHYHRKPVESSFSGEYFWSANLGRSIAAFKQAVYDLRQLLGYVVATRQAPVGVAGFSMGAGAVLALAARVPLPGVFVVNPVCNMSDLVWDSPLFSTIRRDLEGAHLGLPDIQAAYAPFEPLAVTMPATPANRITVGRSLWDQINEQANYDALIQHWNIRNVLNYRAGHLNVLRTPRLAADVIAALQSTGQPVAE